MPDADEAKLFRFADCRRNGVTVDAVVLEVAVCNLQCAVIVSTVVCNFNFNAGQYTVR